MTRDVYVASVVLLSVCKEVGAAYFAYVCLNRYCRVQAYDGRKELVWDIVIWICLLWSSLGESAAHGQGRRRPVRVDRRRAV
jgi:hypothetical protein